MIPNQQVGYLVVGTQSAGQGILAERLAVKMGGPGRFIDVSMTDAVFAHHIMPLLAKNYDGQSPPPARDLLTGGVPCYGVYRCSDGRYLARLLIPSDAAEHLTRSVLSRSRTS